MRFLVKGVESSETEDSKLSEFGKAFSIYLRQGWSGKTVGCFASPAAECEAKRTAFASSEADPGAARYGDGDILTNPGEQNTKVRDDGEEKLLSRGMYGPRLVERKIKLQNKIK